MARRSRMSILKRQRELRKAEKAARKRSRRHGIQEEGLAEPRPTDGAAQIFGGGSSLDESAEDDSSAVDRDRDDTDTP